MGQHLNSGRIEQDFWLWCLISEKGNLKYRHSPMKLRPFVSVKGNEDGTWFKRKWKCKILIC